MWVSKSACRRTRVRTSAFVHSAVPPSTFAFVGSQMFYKATAFNTDIGAWNTASVIYMNEVCAAFGPAARTAAIDARCDAALFRGSTADDVARAWVCARTRVCTHLPF